MIGEQHFKIALLITSGPVLHSFFKVLKILETLLGVASFSTILVKFLGILSKLACLHGKRSSHSIKLDQFD